MTEAAIGPAERRPRVPRAVPVPGYPLDPVDSASDRSAEQSSGFWRVAAVLVQAVLCVLVVLAALSTAVG